MNLHPIDADTAETMAGVVRLLRRAAELVWKAVDADDAGSPRQVLALGIDLASDEARNLLPDIIPVDGPVPAGHEPADFIGAIRAVYGAAPLGLSGKSGMDFQSMSWLCKEKRHAQTVSARAPNKRSGTD
jgi:hypothetical protein